MCARERPSTVYLLSWLVFACTVVLSAAKVAKLDGSEYVGCYRDQGDPRLLTGHWQEFPETLTPQLCVALCRRKGFIYAALEASVRCYCGNEELPASAKVNDTDCSEECIGDRSTICGAIRRLTVYETGNPESSKAKLADLPGKEYVGCYKDQGDPRLLRGHVQDFPETLTPQLCVALCKQKGYIYAGLEYGVQCFCGDEELPSSAKVDDGQCSGKCTGDRSAICGAIWRLTIYKTGNSESSMAKLADLPGKEYVGCYKDQGSPRLLRGHVQDFPETLTPQLCVALCKQKGYIYAGLQYGVQCFCGDEELPSSAKVDDSQCSAKCTGDRSAICGAIWRLTIYKTGNSESSRAKLADLPGKEYVGCYKDQLDPRLLQGHIQDFPETLTPELCVALCKQKGYIYAGLEHSVQCFCGDEELPSSAKVDDSDCSGKCAGDRSAICGAIWRLTIYKTGNSESSRAKLADLPGKEYVGCYKDQRDPRLLRGHAQDFPETLTPELCVGLCKQKGYIYAGLEHSVQCFCGDEELPSSVKVDDSDCSGKCAGDRSAICGAIWRLTIYKTGNSESSKAKVVKLTDKEYVGCYKDQHDPRLLRGHVQDFSETLTPQLCVAICKQKGYIYAGLEYGVQCFCGDEELPASAKVDESDCSGRCNGDKSAICGAIWRLTIYKTDNLESSKANLADLPGKEYVGCYKDQGDPRLLRGHVQDFPETLAPQLCVALCKKKGYIYAGLEYGVQCFCGDEELPSSVKVDDGDCSGRCTGDTSAICGAIWRLTIYKTGNSESSRAKLADLPGREYVGCYKDQGDPRLLRGHVQDFPETLTPQLCAAICKQKGYIYAGLEYGVQCFCGDEELPSSAEVDDSDCSGRCTGDTSAICGAIWRLTIYKTGNSEMSRAKLADLPGREYVGCYKDQGDPRLLRGHVQDFPETLTPQLCAALCKQKGYIYAGLEYGVQCFCGDDELPSLAKVDDNDCSGRCTGDTSAICGAMWRLTIYKTGNSDSSRAKLADLPGREYVGCYKDQGDPRLLRGHVQDFPGTLTPQLCVSLCEKKGYIYAGLEYGVQCFCGDEELPSSAKVDESDCSGRCAGDTSAICGAIWRLTIYKTGNSELSRAKLVDLPGKEYVGCYKDQGDPRLLRGHVQDFPETLTPQLCAALCKQNGYIYAGLEYGVQCFCGDEELPSSAKVEDNDCSGRCTGGISAICGAMWRLTIYKTGNSDSSRAKLADLPGREYVGCYKDQGDPRLLRGHVQDFPETLTPQLCVSLCEKKGYIYAGLEYGVQCFCGDEELPSSAKVDDSICSGRCAGDTSAICGAIWRLTIYKTGNSELSRAKLVDLPGKEYVGCFKDQGDPRLLRGHVQDFPETLTPQLCAALCKQKGYIYAGLEYGVQCFCGDEELPSSAKVDDNDCSGRCTGDTSAICGAMWRLTIYKTGNSDSSRAKMADLPGREYVGCYMDQGDPRLLRGHVQDFPETLTPQLCVSLCEKKGYIYAGLEYGVQCFCGDEELPSSAKVDDSDCSGRCTGDTSAICGAIWRLTIYKTGNSESSRAKLVDLPGKEYVGCYKDQGDPRLLRGHAQDFSETLTPQVCVSLCKQKGYINAGLEYGVQCFCGDEELPSSAKVDDSDCSGRCTGNTSAVCGAIWRLTIYKTGNSESSRPKLADLPGKEYVGCYKDQGDPRLLRGHVQDFPESLTPQLCAALCKQKGYIYTGLEYGVQCFCGDEELPSSAKVDDSDCSGRCTGDTSAICGGIWRLTIYKTGNSELNVAKLAKLAGKEYVGCYKDKGNARLLQGHVQDFPETLTPQLCVTLCKQKGYIYAGLEYGVQCFCGDEELPSSAKVDDSDCLGKCAGDRSVICGAIWRLTIYKTGNSGNAQLLETQRLLAMNLA